METESNLFFHIYWYFSGLQLIEQIYHSGVVLPGPDWQTTSNRGATVSVTYRTRVRCSPHYYGACMKFCHGRDDRFGHYDCDNNGDKVCHQGWMGANCETGTCG